MPKHLFKKLLPYIDIILIFLILIVVFSTANNSFLEMIGSVLLIFFIPGYLFSSALLSDNASISYSLRILLSVGSSVVISGLLYLLISLIAGLNSTSIKLGLFILIAVLSLIVIMERNSVEESWNIDLFLSNLKNVLPNNISGWSKYITLAILIIVFAVYIHSTDGVNARFSEFFILGENGSFEKYPSDVIVNNTLPLTVVVVNHEGQDIEYSVEAKIGDTQVGYLEPFVIKDGDTWNGNISITALPLDNLELVDLFLIRKGDTSSYRSLHFWIKPIKN